MNKLDRYDALKIINIRKELSGIIDYNYSSDSDPLTRKLKTIDKKLERLLDTELEPELQEEWKLLGRV